ncbi:SRPBCC family protein [Egibacter rhizosphaerae]|uniref:SRPBCC family protein n=1 Tax=Egibacter rhizosphaerae TaxID=1670831 RepID=UPI0013F16D4E|nr:SRPBCC family protein [Egibacter rhizosphaerae]
MTIGTDDPRHPFDEGNGGVIVAAESTAPPADVWALLADPQQWARWAPHIRWIQASRPRVATMDAPQRPRGGSRSRGPDAAPPTAPSGTAARAEHSEPCLVAPGDRLFVRGPAGTRVQGVVTHVEPGHRWDFRIRLPAAQWLDSAHVVAPWGTGSRVATRLRVDGVFAGPGRIALEGYRPLARIAMARLARIAAADQGRHEAG